MTRRLFPMLTIVALTVSVLACNLGSGTSPAAPTAAPATVAPTNSISPTVASTAEGGECTNEYYPVVQGATWDYSMAGDVPGQFTRSITKVESDAFTEQDVFSAGITRTTAWKCSDGLIALQPEAGAGASLSSKNIAADFHATDVSGVTVPDQLLPGATWNQSLTLEGTESINGQDVKAKNVVQMDCTAADVESVTVPAGTFEAIRGDCKTDQKVTVTIGSMEVPSDVPSVSTVWYAKGVGMVKMEETVTNGPKSTIELTSYKIP